MRIFLVCLTALVVAGCASTSPGSPGRAPTSPPTTAPPTSAPTNTPSTTSPPTPPASTPPGLAPIQLFANTQALSFSAEPGVVLRGATDVTRFVHWLRTRPRPADADAPVAAALAREQEQAQTLVVIAQNVGCSSIRHVALGTRGTNLVLVPSGVTTHPECYRANVAVAAFAVPAPLPGAVTLNGQHPNDDWR